MHSHRKSSTGGGADLLRPFEESFLPIRVLSNGTVYTVNNQIVCDIFLKKVAGFW